METTVNVSNSRDASNIKPPAAEMSALKGRRYKQGPIILRSRDASSSRDTSNYKDSSNSKDASNSRGTCKRRDACNSIPEPLPATARPPATVGTPARTHNNSKAQAAVRTSRVAIQQQQVCQRAINTRAAANNSSINSSSSRDSRNVTYCTSTAAGLLPTILLSTL
jgi:hypothetical protein